MKAIVPLRDMTVNEKQFQICLCEEHAFATKQSHFSWDCFPFGYASRSSGKALLAKSSVFELSGLVDRLSAYHCQINRIG